MTKVNKYWRSNGTAVKSHSRGKHRARKSPVNYQKRRFAVLCWFMFVICFGGIALNGVQTPKAPEQVQAQEPISQPVTQLTKEQGFESADMPRDVQERERNTIENLMIKYFGKDAETAIRVAKIESSYYKAPVGWKPGIVNDNPKTGDYSIGLFQINLFGKLALTRPSEEWLKNPENNISFAKKLFDYSGGNWKRDWTNTAKKLNLK